MVPQGGGEGEGGVTTLGGEGEGGLPLHLPAAEEVGHRALHQVAGGGHHASLDILAWYFCLKQALVFSICWRGVYVARICRGNGLSVCQMFSCVIVSFFSFFHAFIL